MSFSFNKLEIFKIEHLKNIGIHLYYRTHKRQVIESIVSHYKEDETSRLAKTWFNTLTSQD